MEFWSNHYFLCFCGLLLIAFIIVEFRVANPIFNLSNFAIRNVALSGAVAFCIGFAMFGTINYLPIYFQVIHGDTPTVSGLKLLPAMLGIILLSIGSGIVITKTGYYYQFPVSGSILVCIGSGLIGGLLTVDIDIVELSAFIFIIGLGLGCVIQTLTVIVQSSVPRTDMASATAANAFLRTLGGAVGVAVFGTILNNRLISTIPGEYLPAVHAGYNIIITLPPDVQTMIFENYVDAIQVVFWSGVGVAAVSLLLSLPIKIVKILNAPAAAPVDV